MSESHSSAPSTAATADANHHHDHGHHDVSKHVKGYIIVGILLGVFTAITVFLSYVDFDKWFGGHNWNIIVAMIVATFKASLVAAIFMHLKEERITIWRFLFLTAFFCLGLFLLTFLGWSDPIFGTSHTHH